MVGEGPNPSADQHPVPDVVLERRLQREHRQAAELGARAAAAKARWQATKDELSRRADA